MKNIIIFTVALYLTSCSIFGVNVKKICADSGYFIYEKVDLPPEYIKRFTPEMNKSKYDSRFVLNDIYYIDKEELAKDYIFTLRERESLKGYKTWISITDSIVRKSDGKLLAQQKIYSGYKADKKPWLHQLGHSTKDTSCPNGKISKQRLSSFFNSFNIVKDVFINKDYKWTPESVLGEKAISSGDFEDLCANTGIKIYEKVRIDKSYLIEPIKKENFRGKNYLRYSNFESYFDITKLEQNYIFTYLENQLIPSTKNTRVIRSSITRKSDNKLLGETITVRGMKSDSYTGTEQSNVVCESDKSVQIQKKNDIDDYLLQSVFFKNKIDDLLFHVPKTLRWKDITSQNQAYAAYMDILHGEEGIDLSQQIRVYEKLLYISRNLDNKVNVEEYIEKLISLNTALIANQKTMSFEKVIYTYYKIINLYKSQGNKEGVVKTTNSKIALYDNLLKNKKNMTYGKIVQTYKPLLRLSFSIGDKNKIKKYADEFSDYLKVANKNYKTKWFTNKDLKRMICDYRWSEFKEVLVKHCRIKEYYEKPHKVK